MKLFANENIYYLSLTHIYIHINNNNNIIYSLILNVKSFPYSPYLSFLNNNSLSFQIII